ncbi:hypothetical protein K3729_05360 [Rhodobacteraceae bacterium S2214]|nr:hypothetical protein K3729_05360 [Rhodobacteraceae bacterium S2214]
MQDFLGLANECALEAGALQRCSKHPDFYITGENSDAEAAAFVLLVDKVAAMNLSVNADLVLQPALIFALQLAYDECPDCC